jgi:hypothetical protein
MASLKEISMSNPTNTVKKEDLVEFSPIASAAPKDAGNEVKVPANILGKYSTRESFLTLHQGLKYQFGLEIDKKNRDHAIIIAPIEDALGKIK